MVGSFGSKTFYMMYIWGPEENLVLPCASNMLWQKLGRFFFCNFYPAIPDTYKNTNNIFERVNYNFYGEKNDKA